MKLAGGRFYVGAILVTMEVENDLPEEGVERLGVVTRSQKNAYCHRYIPTSPLFPNRAGGRFIRLKC